jgi:hypothetical protein
MTPKPFASSGDQTAVDLDRDSRGSRRIRAVAAPTEGLDKVELSRASAGATRAVLSFSWRVEVGADGSPEAIPGLV